MTADLVTASRLATSGVVLTPRPFARDEQVSLHALPDGLSVQEMIERLEADGALDPALRPWVRVTQGQARVPREAWTSVRPSTGDTVFVDVAPMAKSNPVRTVLQIAVIAAAAFVGGLIGGVPGALASAGIAVLGNMAVNAIAPIKQPEIATRDPRYSLDGASNAARPFDAIPIVMGQRRLFPPRCANWYTRTVSNVVYLRMMFQPCVGWVDHAAPRIGQTALESFDGVTVRWNTRHDETLNPIWFDRTPAEDSLGLPITSDAGWVTRTAPIAASTLSIDIAFMAGLFETKESSGNPKNRSVTFEFRYGPKGGDPASATACPFTTAGQVTFTRDKLEAYREGHDWNVPFGEYDVHIRRVSPDNSGNGRISDELTWVCIRAFQVQPAVRDIAGRPWIELELQATDQLNGVPNDFNFLATSIVPQATAEGPGDMIVTRNPADLFLAASYPPFSDIDLDDDERGFAAIAAWRATCATEDWTCDLAEAGELSVAELLQRTAAAGRARPTLDMGALSVVVDWAKPYPRQMFTSRNVSGFQGELTYPAEVHALRLRFQNQDKDYADDILTVFADGYTIDTATKYDSLDIRDKTDPDQVEWEGARLLAERVLRPETFTFQQDAEYVTAAEGSRAWLAHHVAQVGEVSARVVDRVVDADDPTRKGLRLDERVVMEGIRAYDLAWRPSSDTPLSTFALQTVDGESNIVWFAAPAPDTDDQPFPGDLVSVYVHAVELLDVIVDRITPKPGLKAQLTCVPYAPELQSVGDGPIPSYRTGSSRPPTLASASIVKRTDRAIDQVIDRIGGAVKEAGDGLEAIEDGTGTMGGRIISEVLDDVGATAGELARNTLADENFRSVQDALNYDGDGRSVKLVALDALAKAVDSLQRLALLGAVTLDREAIVLNADTVKISDAVTLAQHLSLVSSVVGDGSVTVSELFEALNGQAGRVTIAVNNSLGAVTGLDLGVDGTVDWFRIVTSNFQLIDPTGASGARTIFEYADGVLKMGDVEVDTLKVNTVTVNHVQPQNIVVPVTSTGSSTIFCDGTDKVFIDHTVELLVDATVIVTCFLSSHFPSGDKNWTAQLIIDGVVVYDTGGANGEANIPLGGALPCAAGPVLVQVTLNSHASVNVTSRTLTSIGPMR